MAISIIFCTIGGGLGSVYLTVRCHKEQFGQVDIARTTKKALYKVNVLGLYYSYKFAKVRTSG